VENAVATDLSNLRLRNPWSWYVVVASKDLALGTVMPIILNGERLAIWRSNAGKVNAWRDRCPHRGMRLSFGAVHRETLICPYHGWTFGDDARCVRIPAHPDVAPSRAARARLFPVAEVDGYVWVCSGEPSTSAPLVNSGYAAARTLHFQLSMEDAIVAFMTLPCADANLRPAPNVEWSTSGASVNPAWTQARSDTLTARFEAPSSVFCEADGRDGKISYLVRIQPTDPGSCAVHASVEGGDAVWFNRALVRFRAALSEPELGAWLRYASSRFEEIMPASIDGLIQGEAP
jgi:nitrite reductase/ring-hydroxylating ferredoxin subunit